MRQPQKSLGPPYPQTVHRAGVLGRALPFPKYALQRYKAAFALRLSITVGLIMRTLRIMWMYCSEYIMTMIL